MATMDATRHKSTDDDDVHVKYNTDDNLDDLPADATDKQKELHIKAKIANQIAKDAKLAYTMSLRDVNPTDTNTADVLGEGADDDNLDDDTAMSPISNDDYDDQVNIQTRSQFANAYANAGNNTNTMARPAPPQQHMSRPPQPYTVPSNSMSPNPMNSNPMNRMPNNMGQNNQMQYPNNNNSNPNYNPQMAYQQRMAYAQSQRNMMMAQQMQQQQQQNGAPQGFNPQQAYQNQQQFYISQMNMQNQDNSNDNDDSGVDFSTDEEIDDPNIND
eukprot:CAMPEP_0114653434 /NCGR_PEP_ID=MMETSP0191-20121206/9764_1 /TAXON_ID=126664 /ORGANISM="Sorites sp." /LENGTH=271 /DNA_ID=CAMNT_0001868493 /DNA_START=1066 /DNA_END=1881 /DNA_ORIENTATION=+